MKNFGIQVNGGAGASGTFEAEEANSLMREGENAVITSGQSLNDASDYQLSQAMGRYSAVADWYIDTGSVDSFVLTPTGNFRVPDSYLDGMRIRFIAVNSGTGASLVNVNSIGTVPIRKKVIGSDTHAELGYGDVRAGSFIEAVYRSSLNAFEAVAYYTQQDFSQTYSSHTLADFNGTVVNGDVVTLNTGTGLFVKWTPGNAVYGIADITNRRLVYNGRSNAVYSGLTTGATYFADSSVPGGITTVNSLTTTTVVGVAYNASTLLVRIQPPANLPLLFGARNRIINPDFTFNQRVATSIADTAYGHDRWYGLTESGNITVATQSLPFTSVSALNGARLTQPSASAKRIGYAQIIESSNCIDLRQTNVRYDAVVRSSISGDVNVALLEWTGTGDVVTNDIVNNWASSNFTPGNFFLASNVVVRSITTATVVANTESQVTARNITTGSSFNNLILFIWSRSALAQNATLDISNALLMHDNGNNNSSVPFQRRNDSEELALCQRFYEKSYNLNVAPGTASSSGNIAAWTTANAGTTFACSFKVTKRTPPTTTVYSWGSGASGNVRADNSAVPFSFDLAAYVTLIGVNNATVGLSTVLGGSNPADILFHFAATAEL